MVISCVAYGCKNIQFKGNGIHFHSFPFKRPEILKLWTEAIRRQNWTPSKYSRICSQHFIKSDYQDKPWASVKVLKADAVPSIFLFPKHMQAKRAYRRTIIRHETTSDLAYMEIDAPQTVSTNKYVDRATSPMNITTEREVKLYKKVRNLNQKIRTRNMKISTLKQLIAILKQECKSTQNLEFVMENYFGGFPLEFLMHQHRNGNQHINRRNYSDTMKQFAQTVYFYSPKAYNFLRKHFILPNPRTIRSWLSTFNCNVGILSEVIEFLKEESKNKPSIKDCALIFDSMSIRKQICWDVREGRYTGYPDFGGVIDVDIEGTASEVLIFMIVSYKTNFKCPVAYFLTNKIDAVVLSQIIRCCLRTLSDAGILVRSITCDGAAANIQAFSQLGCTLRGSQIVPYFKHPCFDFNVYCMLDTCHMLKLARNTCAEKVLHSKTGEIKWSYLEKLHQLQKKEGLKLANAVTSNHLYYKNKIMNVRLAAQTLSSSVADALEYLKNTGHAGFEGCGATVEFIRIIDRIFDMLNSRNPFGKGFKAPVRPETLHVFSDVFSEAQNYLHGLQIDGINLLNHPRKTFALGFTITMINTIKLAVGLFQNDFSYFLTYKCSQDHLELFFSCLRSRGGWNNNPNSQQLKWSLRQLLFKNQIQPSINSNCTDFGSQCTTLFDCRAERTTLDSEEYEVNNMFERVNSSSLSDIQENIIYYICGYIARKLGKRIVCQDCLEILYYKDESLVPDHTYCSSDKTFHKFVNFRTNNGLIMSSDIVFEIVSFTEKLTRQMITDKKFNRKYCLQMLQNVVVKHFAQTLCLFLPKHPPLEEYIFEELHEIQLIKQISKIYAKCKLHTHAKDLNQQLHGQGCSIRQKYNKLVLFKNT